MKVVIYHNTRCRKSRGGLEFLKNHTDDFEIVEYLKTGLSPEDISKLLKQLNLKVQDIIRTQEDIYKKELKGKNFTNDEWISIISDNLKLLKRPIIVKGNKAVIGETEDAVASLF
ncbi:MAG: arsenate reductase (glutaredoxin) [Marinilabiliales bacterium]|nr:MAG: arsenate reductase (glutaredoxin) [Marinilabiliales bacterium]